MTKHIDTAFTGIRASPTDRSRMLCLRALIFAILLSSIPAYPMPQITPEPVPMADPMPFSDKAATLAPVELDDTDDDEDPAQAPTDSVGDFLGREGLETPAFRKKCKKCCRKTINDLGNLLPHLQSCNKCKINRNVRAKGACAGSKLGHSENPSRCFADVCSVMLSAAKPGCFCLGS